MTRPILTRRRKLSSAFSLVEVVLALAVASVGMAAMFAMMSMGLSMTQESQESSNAAHLLTTISQDLGSLPADNSGTTLESPLLKLQSARRGASSRWLDPQNIYVNEGEGKPYGLTQLPQARFRVSVRINIPEETSASPNQASVRISWPAAFNPDLGGHPPMGGGSLESIVTWFPHP